MIRSGQHLFSALLFLAAFGLQGCKKSIKTFKDQPDLPNYIYIEYSKMIETTGSGDIISIDLNTLEKRLSPKLKSDFEKIAHLITFFPYNGDPRIDGYLSSEPLLKIELDQSVYLLMRSGAWRRIRE